MLCRVILRDEYYFMLNCCSLLLIRTIVQETRKGPRGILSALSDLFTMSPSSVASYRKTSRHFRKHRENRRSDDSGLALCRTGLRPPSRSVNSASGKNPQLVQFLFDHTRSTTAFAKFQGRRYTENVPVSLRHSLEDLTGTGLQPGRFAIGVYVAAGFCSRGCVKPFIIAGPTEKGVFALAFEI